MNTTLANIVIASAYAVREASDHLLATLAEPYVATTGTPLTHRDNWRIHIVQFFNFGYPMAYSQRAMRDAGLCGREAWDIYTEWLSLARVLVQEERKTTTLAPWFAKGATPQTVSGYSRHLNHLLRWCTPPPYPERYPPALFVGVLTDSQVAQYTVAPDWVHAVQHSKSTH